MCKRTKRWNNPTTTIVIDDGVNPTGNACHLVFAYSGNSYCSQVTCVMTGDNHLDLAGEDHACGNAPLWLDWKDESKLGKYNYSSDNGSYLSSKST